MSSDKTAIVDYLFNMYWDEASQSLTKNVMSLEDVGDAIRACNQVDGLNRSDRNPANFLKDIVRSRNASGIWPQNVANRGFTGKQRTGTGECFEFVRYELGQVEPFPDLFRPTESTLKIHMQSVSLPQASKALGRSDEAWLIQTAVNLRVIEQHLATQSDVEVREVVHLQMNVKLRATEIDAIYLAQVSLSGIARKAIVTCEAKNHSERILVDQITSQVIAAFETTDADLVIPMAIRSVRGSGIQVIEFQKIGRDQLEAFDRVQFARDVVYNLVPPVAGI